MTAAKYRTVVAGICAAALVFWATELRAQSAKQFRLGYFEGGLYPVHSLLRQEFARQLRAVLPENYDITFAPEGYRSAGWKRDSCRVMARRLAAVEKIDMIVAMGPWVVEDLLEAGFDKPILAMHQFAPAAAGLIGDAGRPVAPNLTVQVKPAQIEDDLRTLTQLVDVRRLGVLYFPSGDESEKVVATITLLGKTLGIEVVAAEGFDNYGTYAFFKAYRQLGKKIDALYLPPLWGMDDIKVADFLSMVARDGIVTFTSEGRYLVESGAFASNTAYSEISDARYNAVKAARILQGEPPADLPVEFRGGVALALNEQAARQCAVTLPTEAVNSAYLVAAPTLETTPFYTLAEAVQRALSFNPGYLARYDAVEAAAHAAKQAYSPYLPELAAGASAAHFDDNAVANSREALENDRYNLALVLKQRILSVETLKSIRLAARRKDRQQVNLKQARLDLELTVAAAYLNYLGAQEILSTEHRYRTLVDRNLEIAGSRLALEQGSRIDLLRWKDERHKATSRVVGADSDLKSAAVILNALFNLPGKNPISLDSISFSEGRFFGDYDLVNSLLPSEDSHLRFQDLMVAEGLQQSPLLQSLDVDLAIQKELLAKNQARYFPTLDFRASLNWADRLADNPPTFVEKNGTWSLWTGLTLPIFLGTDRIRERAKLKAGLSQVEFEKDAARLEVMDRIRTEAYNLTGRLGSAPRVIRAAELARENLTLVIEQYDAGRLGLVDLLDAFNNARTAELSAIAARYSFYLSMARLVHQIGWSACDRGGTFRDEFYTHLEQQFGN